MGLAPTVTLSRRQTAKAPKARTSPRGRMMRLVVVGRGRAGARRATASPFVVAWMVDRGGGPGWRGEHHPGQVSLTYVLLARKGPPTTPVTRPHLLVLFPTGVLAVTGRTADPYRPRSRRAGGDPARTRTDRGAVAPHPGRGDPARTRPGRPRGVSGAPDQGPGPFLPPDGGRTRSAPVSDSPTEDDIEESADIAPNPISVSTPGREARPGCRTRPTATRPSS